MRGSVFQRCFCRDPETRRPLGRSCPKLKTKGHAAGWFFRYDAPRGPEGKRRQPEVGPFSTQKAAEEALAAELARIGGGSQVTDRGLLIRDYLDQWLAARKLRLKPRTFDSYREAAELYFKPALGHLRLVDLRSRHLQDLVGAMMQVNRPLPEGEKPSELLRRLLAARADDDRRDLAEDELRHKKSTRPLSPARIEREFAVIRAALNNAVPGRIMVNPYDEVVLPRVDRAKPLAWTPQREAAFRKALGKRLGDAETAAAGEHRVLTTVQRQEIWAAGDLRPSSVMVWLPEHTGQFLDFIESERLFALFCLVAYCGLRRDEAVGLAWAETDLEQGTVTIRETGTGDGPKSEAGVRVIPLPVPVVTALRAWRKQQAADQLAWGIDWPDSGRVFTREDGTTVSGQWVSTRFETLAYRAGLPPVRFHDLRHGAASLCKAAGLDTKFISALLGHSRTSFTDATYITLFPEIQRAAAEAAAAIVPRRTLAKES